MFVRNCWYVVGWTHELDGGAVLARSALNEPLAIYRAENGEAVALEDRCPHRFAPLSRGRREGGDLRCMYHGLRFSPSGACVEIPGQDAIPAAARVRRYPVVERHSWIWVWMGDPARADAALVPPAVGLDDPAWILRSGEMTYEAGYQLINDNLTDFSHLSYVHANSFGATEEFARTRPAVTRLERGIRVQRWIVDGRRDTGRPSPFPAFDFPTASWQAYDFLVPGILLMRSAMYRREDMEAAGGGPPLGEPLRANFTSQAVTPITDTTSCYRYSWGPDARTGTQAQAELMLKVAAMAFEEDRQMIEAQQRVIDGDPERRMVLTNADVGPVQMRQVIERLAAADALQPS
jgi:vanillate O-demethylase monooxygenase subunit